MRVSTYQNKKGEDRVGIQLTLAEAAKHLAKVSPDAKLSLTFSPEQAAQVASKVNGELAKAFSDAGIA